MSYSPQLLLLICQPNFLRAVWTPHPHFPSSESLPPPQRSGPTASTQNAVDEVLPGPLVNLRRISTGFVLLPGPPQLLGPAFLSLLFLFKERALLSPEAQCFGPLAMTPPSSLCPPASWKPHPYSWLPSQFNPLLPQHGSSSFSGQPWSFHSFLSSQFPVHPVEKAMAPHSRTLAWKIPWMEEPGGLQSMGSGRVRHD